MPERECPDGDRSENCIESEGVGPRDSAGKLTECLCEAMMARVKRMRRGRWRMVRELAGAGGSGEWAERP